MDSRRQKAQKCQTVADIRYKYTAVYPVSAGRMAGPLCFSFCFCLTDSFRTPASAGARHFTRFLPAEGPGRYPGGKGPGRRPPFSWLPYGSSPLTGIFPYALPAEPYPRICGPAPPGQPDRRLPGSVRIPPGVHSPHNKKGRCPGSGGWLPHISWSVPCRG